MKAISLWQPWSIFIPLGLKQFETRSWYTSHRGEIAIHAAKRWTRDEQAFAAQFTRQFRGDLTLDQINPIMNPPLGAVLCICDLTDCLPTRGLKVSDLERAVGNYAPYRFAWKLELIEVFDTPIPAKGMQGLWEFNR